MPKNKNFDYSKAEADLEEAGACDPEEVYEYSSEYSLKGFMAEHGLDANKYMKKSSSDDSKKKDEGCYLTTACVTARGLGDDCAELNTLRAFRDNVLKKRPGGKEDIEEYYATAPAVVRAIDGREDRKAVWDRVYDELVAPCVKLINAGEYDRAYDVYKARAGELKEKYGRS